VEKRTDAGNDKTEGRGTVGQGPLGFDYVQNANKKRLGATWEREKMRNSTEEEIKKTTQDDQGRLS